jgi:very-short-patch-repair endonuclease
MNAADTQKATVENPALPELQPGLVEALTAAYATLLKRQRTASAAYVRWTTAHSRAHEFAWFEGGNETLLTKGGNVVVEQESLVHSMTPDDVARLFPCAPGLFDVVIIDEASQCDLPSMTPVLFRAKQAVIAGDSRQMQAQRFAFTANQVSAQAWAEHGLDRLDPDKWLDPAKIDLLQLASIRMDEEAFLDEHYRSLPAIIDFSNQRWYGGRLRLMRDQDDKQFGDPDSPVINLHRVRGSVTPGTQENDIEARDLVTHLHQMLRHPGYSEASFGVICLFEEQMRLVNDLVAEQIPDELRSSHDLVVVNPDGFQGDERDVILYSLSFDAAGMTQQALSARQADREHIQGMLNVAFTRARDEIHIFHSADVSDFGMTSGSGAIRDWLEYCDQHCNGRSAATADAEIQLSKAQSEFEQQVMASLVSKGVKVTSQYPTCGFFIDVVAELNDSRLAIECDGEIWHLDEHGEMKREDIERQEILERAGWNVIRIPYRSWRENPEAQVHRILDELNNSEPLTTPEVTQAPEDAQVSAIAVDRFEDALLQALKSGLCSRDEVFKASRHLLGYSRMGPQIRVSLGEALERVVKKGFVRVEDDEAFFSNEAARSAHYEVRTIAPASFPRPRGAKYRRYRS